MSSVAGRRSALSHQLMDRETATSLIAHQKSYIESIGKLIDLRGYLGMGKRAVGV